MRPQWEKTYSITYSQTYFNSTVHFTSTKKLTLILFLCLMDFSSRQLTVLVLKKVTDIEITVERIFPLLQQKRKIIRLLKWDCFGKWFVYFIYWHVREQVPPGTYLTMFWSNKTQIQIQVYFHYFHLLLRDEQRLEWLLLNESNVSVSHTSGLILYLVLVWVILTGAAFSSVWTFNLLNYIVSPDVPTFVGDCTTGFCVSVSTS